MEDFIIGSRDRVIETIKHADNLVLPIKEEETLYHMIEWLMEREL